MSSRLSAEDGTFGIFVRRPGAGRCDRMGRRVQSHGGEKSARNESRGAADYLRNGNAPLRGGDCDGCFRGRFRSQKPKVKIKAGKAIAKQVSLEEIKADKLFKDSPLVLMGRLSVVPLTMGQYQTLSAIDATSCLE